MSEEKKIPAELKERLKAEFGQDWRKQLRQGLPVKDRMKIGRRRMPERDAKERSRVFLEVNLGLDPAAARKRPAAAGLRQPDLRLRLSRGHRHPSFVKLIERASSRRPRAS